MSMESDDELDRNKGSIAEDNILFKTSNNTTANVYNKQVSGLDLTGLGVGQRFDEIEESGFDTFDQTRNPGLTNDIFNFGPPINNAANDELAEAMALENGQNIEDEGLAQNTLQINVFIGFDEDEPDHKSIDLNQVFQREDLARPYYVEVSN